MAAALRGAPRPLALDPTIRAGLAASPEERPDARAIIAALG
jgi:hypothetical protein